MQKTIAFYRDQFILCTAAIPLGVVIGAICAFFGSILLKITDFRNDNYALLLPFLGLAGVLITCCHNHYKGMALLFEVHQGKRTAIPLRLIPMIMGSTWLTHLFGGSAGREGAAVQIGGTLGDYVGNKISVRDGCKCQSKFRPLTGLKLGHQFICFCLL